MENNKVSVIVPVYNGEDYIEETLQRILAGTYEDLEIVTVIDGCHDRSQEICQQMAERDARVKVFYKENGGIAAARNYGIAQATGAYIALCDQDDLVEPEMYERIVTSMVREEAEFGVCSCGKMVDGSKIPLETFDDGVLEGEAIYEELLYPILFNGYQVPISMTEKNRYPDIWKSVIRKDFWDRHQLDFHSYVSFEDDFLLIVKILSLACKVCTVSYCGYLWRINMASESHSRKYIADIGQKQRMWVQDVCDSIALTTMNQEHQQLIKQVMNCRMYVDAILNLCSPFRKESFGELRQYYDKNIYCHSFEESIVAGKYAQKQFPMQYVLLRILRGHHTYASYFAARLLAFVVDRVYQSSFLMKLDSIMKGK